MYTIGQVSQMTALPVSTLRYYDKEGLFPEMERTSGIRRFTDREVSALKVIECLKKSGLEIREIKQFMQWCAQGEATYPERLELFRRQRESIEEEMERLRRAEALIEYKCWFYETAMREGGEARIRALLPDRLPAGIQELYDYANERGDCCVPEGEN